MIPLNRLQLPHANWRQQLVARPRSAPQVPDQTPEPIIKLNERIVKLEKQLQERHSRPRRLYRDNVPHPVGEIKKAQSIGYRYEPRADLTDTTHCRYRTKSCDIPLWVQSDQTRHSDLGGMLHSVPTVWRSEATDLYRPFATVPVPSREAQGLMIHPEQIELGR